ncbi:hypothetical protein K488DRAFT_53500 [Vararia minispora EC-137]|uniref:Uncharacterized protein n=1 Tax=Vararia minispora EC-137 TaxID=1314806 RepID=A0ACB8QGG4_9AGAM|nr:hypothetical protein K488DRAFT_53500 [Vararia minispora EC-137]
MTSVAARKKSIVAPSSVQIDIPVANNTLLNKAASQSTSLYQQASSLRNNLLRVRGFPPFFSISAPDSSRQSTDPVTQIWDCFVFGTPLCYLYNLLPPPHTPIAVQVDPGSIDPDNERQKKHAIALFSIAAKTLGRELLSVRDIWDRNNTDGFVKVVDTVNYIVSILPPDVFVEPSPLSPSVLNSHTSTDSLTIATPTSVPATAQEAARNNIIRELVETERKYVQDLEVMQKYSQSLAQAGCVTQDTLHLLFPNLNQLLNFQRKFLIRVEGTAEMPWKDQRWGVLFSENEEEFAVYEPYCANYTNAADLMLTEEAHLATFNHVINVKSELPAFLIKPVQRICKYPLLLDSLIKAASPDDYPHYDELKNGSAAAKRITDKINEAQRRAENIQTVQNLAQRVEDWKGHHVSHFGDLLLDDVFTVTKSEVDREYHVFLFERIILCCKEDLGIGNGKKGNKSNSILKKPQTPLAPASPIPGPSKKATPLLLKGRIYLNNVTDAKSVVTAARSGSYSLNIWWKGDDDLEFFTLRCRNEEQVRQWETSVKRLIERLALRRASERGTSRLAYHTSNGATPTRASISMSDRSVASVVPSLPPHPYANGAAVHPTSARPIRQPTYVYGSAEEHHAYSLSQSQQHPAAGYGPAGYPPHDGFEPDDDYEDYPSPLTGSGRVTPMDIRRGTAPSFDQHHQTALANGVAYTERPRAQTEDASGANFSQWRQQNGGMPQPPAVNGLPNGPRMTAASRMNSAASFASDSSFGTGVRHSSSRPSLRTQMSQTRLRQAAAMNGGEDAHARSAAASPTPPSSRSRSASQPSAYAPKHGPPPPLPNTPWEGQGETKRSSGSSHSTGDESGYSPGGSSPLTPFGSSDSSLSAITGRSYDMTASQRSLAQVKVKVHFGTDIFVVQVPRSTEYHELVEKVGKKIRLCGPRRDDGPLRVKYEDEDGDLISMRSTEDVDMAFASRPQVVLHVA